MYKKLIQTELFSAHQSSTDKRLVVDIVAGAYSSAEVSISLDPDTRTVTATGNAYPKPRFDLDRDLDTFGFNAIKEDWSFSFKVDKKYDLETYFVEPDVGTIRVSFMKLKKPAIVLW